MRKEKYVGEDVKAVRERAGLSQEQLAQLLGASWVTISRWEREVSRPSAHARARLERLRELEERIGDALPREEVPHFLQTPHRLLRGYRPMDLLESDYAFHDLLAFVDAAKSGDMA
jgi:transcriptional regulator with XRE-family HTH domain